jgi:hypothetical protein
MTKRKMPNSSSVTLQVTSLDTRYRVIFCNTLYHLYSNSISTECLVYSFLSLSQQTTDNIFQATSAGLKEQEAINFLEKKMKDSPQFTYDETVQVNFPSGTQKTPNWGVLILLKLIYFF